MTIIHPTPVFMTNAAFLVPTNDFAAALTSVAFIPKSTKVQVKGLKAGAVYSRKTATTWTLDFTAYQDFSVGSLWSYLFDNDGDSVAVSIDPEDGGATFTATVIIEPGQAGGAIDGFPTFSVSLAVVGDVTKGA